MLGKMRVVAVAALCLLLLTAPALAQEAGPGSGSGFEFQRDVVGPAILSVVFTMIGLVLFGVCLWLIVTLAPFSVRKEIEEDQNVALGVIIGSMILGIAIILAAALLG